jgi:hypothetical protein
MCDVRDVDTHANAEERVAGWLLISALRRHPTNSSYTASPPSFGG